MSNLSQLELKEKLAYVWKKVRQRFDTPLDKSPQSLGRREVLEANLHASRNYVPQAYPGRVTLFQAKLRSPRVYSDPQGGWGEAALGGVEVYEVPGDHTSVIEEPHVRVLAEKLKACLDKAIADNSEDYNSEPKNSTIEGEGVASLQRQSEGYSSEPKKSTMKLESAVNLLNPSGSSSPCSSLMVIQPNGSKAPLFCIHVLGRGLKFYRPLAHHLGPEQPLYGLAAQVMDKKYAPPNRVEDLAAHYIKEMRILQPEGPYFMAGVSFGGSVAFEMAQQLHAQGQKVALLALLDTYSPEAVKRLPSGGRLSAHWSNFLQLGPIYVLEKAIENVKGKIQRFNDKLNHSLKGICCKFYLGIGRPLPNNLQDFTFQQENNQALRNYVPQVYPGRVTLFRSRDQFIGVSSYRDPQLGWGELAAGGLEIHEVPGTHLGLLQEPYVQVLAEKLRACIDARE